MWIMLQPVVTFVDSVKNSIANNLWYTARILWEECHRHQWFNSPSKPATHSQQSFYLMPMCRKLTIMCSTSYASHELEEIEIASQLEALKTTLVLLMRKHNPICRWKRKNRKQITHCLCLPWTDTGFPGCTWLVFFSEHDNVFWFPGWLCFAQV